MGKIYFHHPLLVHLNVFLLYKIGIEYIVIHGEMSSYMGLLKKVIVEGYEARGEQYKRDLDGPS